MREKFFADYYPVYKDISDIIKTKASEPKLEIPFCESDYSSKKQISGSDTPDSPPILNAEELAELALKCGFSTFQIIILLIKNAFEGHVYLTYHIRSNQLFRQGSILFQAKPEMMILNFYEHFSEYITGFKQIEKLLHKKREDLDETNFESLVQMIMINHIIRFPVSIFSSYSIRSFTESTITQQQSMDQLFEMAILGEHAIGEYEFIERVNLIYDAKFKECRQHLKIKKDMFSHFQRRLVLALYPNIYSEEELDELMYKKLIEDNLNVSKQLDTIIGYDDSVKYETTSAKLRIRDKTKVLYRSVSKNCFEVLTTVNEENSFPELNHIFQTANSIYNENASALSEALLQNIRMLLLLSKVLIFRATQGLAIKDSLQLMSAFGVKEGLVSKDDSTFLRKNLEGRLVAYRIKSFTDYKIKFVMDDDLTEIHKNFLQKEMDFIDQQIIQIQSDTKEILKSKSQVSLFKTSKN